MDFSSFDITESNEQPSHSMTSLDVETFDQDTSAFFDFIDPTNFNATTAAAGTDQQQHHGADSHVVTIHSDVSAPMTNNASSLMSPMYTDPFLTPSQQPMNADCLEDEAFLTPLVSPAIPPNYFGNLRSDTNFSPLTSPALGPQAPGSIGHQLEGYQLNTYSTQQGRSSEEELEEQLAMIERQQQQLRSHMQQNSSSSVQKSAIAYGNTSFLSSSSTTTSPVSSKPKQQTLRHKIAMSSPKFNPVTHLRSPGIHPQTTTTTQLQSPIAASHYLKAHTTMAPATPSLLMKLGNGTTHQNSSSNCSNNSPMASPHDTMIDTMMALPDAMLPPPSSSSDNASSTTKKTAHINHTKRRRISYPRSAFTPPALLPSYYPYPTANGIIPLDQGVAALISPAALRPHPPPAGASVLSSSPGMSPKGGNGNGMIPSSPRALKPWISPKSHTDEQQAATILASKSNYQALREAQATSLLGTDFSSTTSTTGMDHRRSAHKAAEQRRRDTLKQCFDALRMELLESMVAEDALQEEEDDDKAVMVEEREKKVKQMSKVVLLQHSYEYLLRLKSDHQRKEAKMNQMTMEIQQLRTRLGMAPMTEQERQAEAEEKQEQKKNRLARLKRWEDVGDT